MKKRERWYRIIREFNARGVKVGFSRWPSLRFAHHRAFYRDYTQSQPSWHWSLFILGFGIWIVMPPEEGSK